MPRLVCLHAKEVIERWARQQPFLHLYELGDLDDFFWPATTWYAWQDGDEIRQIALLYANQNLPVLLALAEPPATDLRALLQALLPLLPRRFHAHLEEGSVSVLTGHYHVEAHGGHLKMGLLDTTALAAIKTDATFALTPADSAELRAFYDRSYPGNWFVPRMLETGCYVGVRQQGELASVAGVHVYSLHYRIAALGNITTRPELRGQGHGARVTARLCQHLLTQGIEHIGLNVRADNGAAIACYRKLGFRPVARYGEYLLTASSLSPA